jgi:hypothetical protein
LNAAGHENQLSVRLDAPWEKAAQNLDKRGPTLMASGRPMAERNVRITYPSCGHAAAETMPLDCCVFFYECTGCGVLLKPKAGDCCVYCSYGDQPCPPMQHDALSQGGAD